MKAKIFMIIGALLASLLVSAQQPMTLQQCVDSALANNRNIKQKAITKKTNEIAYQQARLDLLPNLNASANQAWTFGRSQIEDGTYQNINSSNSSFNISSGINLFDGLKMKYNIDVRMAEMNVSEAELQKIREDIVLSVSSAYLQVLLNKELLLIANNQLTITESKIEQQKSLVEAGKMAEGEMYELYAQLSKEESNKVQAENNLKLSLLDLAQILELQDFEKLDIIVPEDFFDNELQLLDAKTVYESAITHRPEVKSAEYQLISSERNVLIAKSAYFPSLDFGVNVGGGYYNSVGIPISTSLGFNLRIPIFNKFETRNQVKTANLRVESNRLNVENTKLEMQKTIQQAYFNAVAAKAKWDASKKSELANKEANRFANQKYENGRATVYELNQAKNNLAQVQSEVVQSKYEYIFRIKILELLK